jgi:hypothetical protein
MIDAIDFSEADVRVQIMARAGKIARRVPAVAAELKKKKRV